MSNDSIHIVTTIHAPVGRVWRAWADAGEMTWFGSDPEGWVVRSEMDVRVGGRFTISFQNSDGEEHTCSGVYASVEEPLLLSFSWEWANEPGVESQVTVRLEPEGGDATRLDFTHADVGYASAHDYEMGWRATFEKLERKLSVAQ